MTQTENKSKVGVWLVGAFGGVGTSIAMGIAAMKRRLAAPTALATEAPPFDRLDFPGFDEITVGGHDVRRSCLCESAAELHRSSGVFSADLLSGCEADLTSWSKNIRPGILRNSGKPVEEFADWKAPQAEATALETVERLAADLREFRQSGRFDHVIVVNVSSSEPMLPVGPEHESWDRLEKKLASQDPGTIPASSLYALAAIEQQCSYVNFTPSLGIETPALLERARQTDILYMGRDGKTGETLMKAVLAPMFLRRNLEVMSWVGHNILGNRDGKVLQDPVSKQGKLDSKAQLVEEILGYAPQSLVTIEHIESMGDWKTAWDHIHFKGFLGTKMSLQFTWQGCDSLLAAPLAIDLIRWTELARRRGETGCMTHLASYFKSPMNARDQDFHRQWDALVAYSEGT